MQNIELAILADMAVFPSVYPLRPLELLSYRKKVNILERDNQYYMTVSLVKKEGKNKIQKIARGFCFRAQTPLGTGTLVKYGPPSRKTCDDALNGFVSPYVPYIHTMSTSELLWMVKASSGKIKIEMVDGKVYDVNLCLPWFGDTWHGGRGETISEAVTKALASWSYDDKKRRMLASAYSNYISEDSIITDSLGG